MFMIVVAICSLKAEREQERYYEEVRGQMYTDPYTARISHGGN